MNHKKILMGKIDYINAFPVYYGLDHGMLPKWIEMVPGPPAVLNKMIQEELLHVSPVSAAFYAMNHRKLLVLPDLSISCYGKVLSVVLMTNLSLEELHRKKVILTHDSATASALVRLVFSQKGIEPVFFTGKLRELNDVPGDVDAAMIIGDAAMTKPWEDRFLNRIDLGELWYNMTGLPFVFALWVSPENCIDRYRDELKDALTLFYESRKNGYENIDSVIESGASRLNLDKEYVRRYFELLHCNLDMRKIDGLKHFFSLLHEHGLLKEKVNLRLLDYP
ncbi:putative periplasmic solute-binding protein [Desulfamplus magnetovallimortis]|uniref:Chorismate dehydratase n=1 Tax=Desulfamplus magnetovallimortis TaxID=1246637 RepID=A0A1W1HCB8_9BACT|nr:menaquinone biosynthesis protein [Desulfamplus magnetovallimortis]SLM30141.1 putative periplasmic solute-binding protein [Desulfamplus magnetovallimortis]